MAWLFTSIEISSSSLYVRTTGGRSYIFLCVITLVVFTALYVVGLEVVIGRKEGKNEPSLFLV